MKLIKAFLVALVTQFFISAAYASTTYLANSSSYFHSYGSASGTAWEAPVGAWNAMLSYGPYVTADLGYNKVSFSLAEDNNTSDDNPVVEIDVAGNAGQAILASRTITRKQFSGTYQAQDFSLIFNNPGYSDLEYRVHFVGYSYIKHLSTTVTAIPGTVYLANSPSYFHSYGSASGTAWQGSAGTWNTMLSYGPYTTADVGYNQASFSLLEDNNTSDDNPVVQIDVAANSGQVILASQTITRKQFRAANTPQSFLLDFYNSGYNTLEYRVHFVGYSYIMHLSTVVRPLPTIDIAQYGATCDGNSPGLDTAALTAATQAAGNGYKSNGIPTVVKLSAGQSGLCTVNSTITVPSGTHIVGAGGAIQAVGKLDAVFQSNGGNDISYDMLEMTASPSDVTWGIAYLVLLPTDGSRSHLDGPYEKFSITNTDITGTQYAIAVDVYDTPDGFSRKLNNVNISYNFVVCNLVDGAIDTQCRDGIHLTGEVFGARIDSNVVRRRGDAAYALSSTGGKDLNENQAFGSLLSSLTPTNVQISNNQGVDNQICLDFSGGNNVVASGNSCSDGIAMTGSAPSMRFTWGGFYPLPSNISVNGGSFSNALAPNAEQTNVKMDFSNFATNGQYPVCNCTVSNARLSGSIYMLGNTFTIDHATFAAGTVLTLATEPGDTTDMTNAIVISNSTWDYPRTINVNNGNGGISNSYLINDYYAGVVSAQVWLH